MDFWTSESPQLLKAEITSKVQSGDKGLVQLRFVTKVKSLSPF